MPGTTRYSATFDRTYEEDDRVGSAPPANTRRSRSQSWQAHSGLDGRPYTPLGARPPAQRSSSTDSGASKLPEHIPTRTVANTAVKAHNNPFQFVKVGTCPLYRKAEEQLKKTKEVKKQDVFREEEEEWQSNLDSWKSRRRKMSEDVFRRQEEIKQFELEEQVAQVSQKKTKTFSEMVESRAHRGRALSLCLISNPLEFQDWEYENKSNTNGSCSTFTDESEENSTVNSEDEGVSFRGRPGRPAHHDNQKNLRTNGETHIEQNGSKLETHNGDFNNVQMKPKEGSYIDSGLESISSSHRAGDTPDSGSDFSQDSNSSIDCESPRTGVNILEEFSSKSIQMSSGEELSVKLNLANKGQEFGFQFQGGKDAGQVLITSVIKGSKSESSGIHVDDQIITVDGTNVSSKTHAEIISMVQKGQEKGEISLLLWRHIKTTNGFNTQEKQVESSVKPNKKDNQIAKSESHQYEKSIESENEMYVDDFEELQRQSELLTSNKKSETTCTNSQAQSKGNTSSTILSSDKDSIKPSSAPKLTEQISNGAVDKQNKNEKTDSEISTESPKKNIVKVKRVRRKGVYALDVSGTPNPIPQEGIPIGSLYPLSPVTELPSPADETKTMASTLSSTPTTPVSNIPNGISLKEKVKETEIKVNSSAIKENNKSAASVPKSVGSKTTAPSDGLKISTSDKVESKTDSTSVPSSPTVTKNKDISLESSVEEKPKLPSSPKKVKVKVKKANSSSEQKSSESSQDVKETPSSSVAQTSDSSVKKPESQPKTSVTDDKTVKINKNENLESSQKRENSVSSTETAVVKSDAISSSSKDKTSSIKAETPSDTTRNLSLKIGTVNGSVNLTTTLPVTSAKPPKTPVDEKSKPPFAPKKEKIKPKEDNTGSTPVISEAKSLSSKGKTAVINNDSSADKTKNLSLKTETQCESVHLAATSLATNSKPLQTPPDEKAKPSFVQKKEKTKSKESCIVPVESAINVKDIKSTELKDKISVTSADKSKNLSLNIDAQSQTVNLASAPPVPNAKPPKTPQDEKSKPPFAQKKEKTKPKEDNSLTTETSVSVQEAKSNNLKDKSAVTDSGTSPNKKKNLSLIIPAQNQSVNSGTTPPISNAKQPKTPQGNKSKPSFAQKKEKTKSKGKTPDLISSDSPQEAKETFIISITTCSSPAVNFSNESLFVKELNSISDEMAVTASIAKGNADSSETMENGTLSDGTLVGTQETKSTQSMDKISAFSPVASSYETKNLSLSIDVQNQSVNTVISPPVVNTKPPKTPQDEKAKPSFAQKKERSKSKENNSLSPGTPTSLPELESTGSKEKSAFGKTKNLSLKIDAEKESVTLDTTPPTANNKPPKTPQDEKTKPRLIRKRSKSKGKATECVSPSVLDKESSNNSLPCTPVETLASNNEPHKEQNSGSVANGEQVPVLNERTKSSETRESNTLSSGASTILTEMKSTGSKEKSNSSDKTKNLSLQIDTNKEMITSDATPLVASNQQPKTPQDEKTKPRLVRKRSKSKGKATEPMSPGPIIIDKEPTNNSLSYTSAETVVPGNDLHKEQNSQSAVSDVPVNLLKESTESSKTRDNNASSAETAAVIPDKRSTASKDKISVANTIMDSDKTRNLTLKTDAQNQSMSITVSSPVVNAKTPQTPADEKPKPSFAQKKENTKPKNTNSQKVNSPAKQNEELKNLNIDSLNVIFQSEPKNTLSENQPFNDKNSENNNSSKKAATDLVPDIPPVEKVAEEMEKLILEQLEEEERAKELASQQTKSAVGSPEHLLIAPPRLAEPPKEKPPPPPSASEGSQKDSSLKRVNSTKRIKKEIHKRRSNFLGIDNADESIVCSEPSIPPPPALEEILKAEMELDRQSRLKIESAATERLTLEEKEIMQKEREIIESLECEERQKQLLNGTEDFKNALPTTPSDVYEDDRILSLKNERKRIETERLMTEEQQQLNLLEEKQLREREELIRKHEAGKSAGSHSDSSLSVAANAPNNSKPAISSLTETKPKVSLSDTCGDGGNLTSNSSAGVSENKSSDSDGKDKTSEKPAVPPKPLKKKEAIRKERERLRQEQETLQREREEHRQKLILEQEELMKHQKSHAPDAPVTQLGPLPPLVPPNFPPQLTTTMNATPNARESASFPSRSHHGASNGAAGNINAVELMGPPIVRQNRLPASRKAVQNEAWGQQKMPSVRKQNHDSLTESRYNQNHWLIQEAEMRRITELKERQQRTTQLPCSQTHLAEDDVCSNPPRVPVIQPTPNPHLNYAVQDKMWNYGQSSMPPKKYPPPVVKDPLHTVYPREAVSQQPPTKPSRVVPMERQEQMLSVSGRKRCSHCNEELGRGAAMIIESLQLYYHIHCFQCCVCQAQLGNGSCGTDVRVRNNKLHCHNCYSNDEAGLKFSQV